MEEQSSKKNEKALELLERFNDGDGEDILVYFSDNIKLFFLFLKKYDLLNQVNLDSIPTEYFTNDTFDFMADNGMLIGQDYDSIPDEFVNRFLLYNLENDRENTINYIISDIITDVYLKSDGNFYLYLRETEELASYFCDSSRHDVSPADVAKQVFSDEGLGNDWYFDYYPENVYREVVDDLNEENTNHLKNYIFNVMGNKDLPLDDYDNEFFQSLTNTDTFRLTMDDINRLVSNESVMNELFEKDLNDLKSELNTLYFQATNSAYESEIYDDVYNGLETYFKGKIIWEKKEESTKYDGYIQIDDFIGYVELFLNAHINDSEWPEYRLEFYGSYTPMMEHLMEISEIDCINFRIPEYPDWSRTKKYINELFSDYI
jgi:hypothetical protein